MLLYGSKSAPKRVGAKRNVPPYLGSPNLLHQFVSDVDWMPDSEEETDVFLPVFSKPVITIIKTTIASIADIIFEVPSHALRALTRD